jgi:hypothetical protein
VTQCALSQVPQPAWPRPAAPAAGLPGLEAPAPADAAHITQVTGICMRQAQQPACAGPGTEPHALAAAGAARLQQGKACSLIRSLMDTRMAAPPFLNLTPLHSPASSLAPACQATHGHNMHQQQHQGWDLLAKRPLHPPCHCMLVPAANSAAI